MLLGRSVFSSKLGSFARQGIFGPLMSGTVHCSAATRFRDPASWPSLAAGMSSRNLGLAVVAYYAGDGQNCFVMMIDRLPIHYFRLSVGLILNLRIRFRFT